MALTRDEVYNAIVRAKCGLSDIYLELVKARAQGSKAATDLRKKAATLFAYISALENVLDCDPPPTSTSNPSAPVCDLDALFVGKCYTPDPDVIGTGLLTLVVLAGSSSVPYQDYYYEYETSDDPAGPWTSLTSEHGNYLEDVLLDSSDVFIRIKAQCSSGDYIYIITQTKTEDGTLDYNSFGYIHSSINGTTSSLTPTYYTRDTDVLTISNSNTELIIESIINLRNLSVLGTNGNSLTVPVGSGLLQNNDQLAVTFKYLPVDLGCSFTRIVTLKIFPTIDININTPFVCDYPVTTLTADYGYTYLWNTGETTQSIQVTEAGTYTCLVTYGNLTQLVYETISELGSVTPQPYLAFTDGTPVPDNYTFCSVSAPDVIIKDHVYTTGYTNPSRFQIMGVGLNEDPNTYQAPLTQFISGGFITIFTPETSNCHVTVPIINYSEITVGAQFVATNVSCSGLSDGTLNIDLFSSAAYSDYILTLIAPDGVTVIGTYNALAPTIPIFGLPAGTYTYNHDITLNGVDCTYMGSAITITEPAAIVIDSVVKTNISCNGAIDGSIVITAHGGTAPLTYSLNTTSQSNGSFIGLKPDTYTVVVTDDNGCQVTAGTTYTVTEPALLTVTAEATACYEVLNPGVITYSGFTGGSGTLTTLTLFDSIGNVVEDISGLLPIGTYDFLNLTVGDYIIYAQDTNGCTYISPLISIVSC
jgi:SprB repeat